MRVSMDFDYNELPEVEVIRDEMSIDTLHVSISNQDDEQVKLYMDENQIQTLINRLEISLKEYKGLR